MKMISVVTPCYNEEDNIEAVCQQVKAVFAAMPQYTYEHLFIDNASTDKTVDLLRDITKKDPHVKIICNARNFGPVRSPYYGLLQASGDAVICLSADLQEPPEMIKAFAEQWELGYKIVAGVKTESHESPLIFFGRKLYYKFIAKIADVKLIKNFHGFGLYDKTVIAMFRTLEDPYPYLRGLVSELGYKLIEIPYTQQIRRHGTTKANFFVWYDWIMLGITSHSKFLIRLLTMTGFFVGFLSFLTATIFTILKCVFWSSFNLGIAPILIGVFFFSALQLFFIGVLGEYILSINTRVIKRPLVIEEERINFDN